MGLFDAFSSKASKNAARAANVFSVDNANRAQVAATQAKQEGIGYIDQAQQPQLDALSGARTAALSDIGSLYGQARDQYSPYVADGRRADGVYQDSLGLNGQGGYDRTLQTYHESPGVRFAINEATDQAERARGAIGQLGSGNTVQEVGDRTGHLADEDLSRWQGQVKGIGDRGYEATGRVAGLYSGEGDARAGIDTNYGGNVASIYGNDARTKAGLATHEGDSIANTLNGISRLYSDNVWGAAKGQNQANANEVNFGMNLADMGLKASGIGGYGFSGLGGKSGGSGLAKIG